MRDLLVVGTSFGKEYLEAAKTSENWQIAGIVARTEQSVQKTLKQYNLDAGRGFHDLDQALSEVNADAVVIAVPNQFHYDIAKKVVDAGKHLIIEKPITETWAQATDLVEGLQQHGKVGMVGQTLRGILVMRMMAHYLNEGIIGDIEQMTFTAHWNWLGDPAKSWRFGLENMYLEDIGIHQFDLIRMMLNDARCHTLTGRTYNPPSYPLPIQTTASGIMEFEKDIHVNYFASQSTKGEQIGWFGRMEIFGNKGSMIRDAYGQPYVTLENGEKFGLDDKYGDDIDEVLPLIEFEKIAYLLEDFGMALDEKRPPITNLPNNLYTHAILMGMKKSAATHQEIDMFNEFPTPN